LSQIYQSADLISFEGPNFFTMSHSTPFLSEKFINIGTLKFVLVNEAYIPPWKLIINNLMLAGDIYSENFYQPIRTKESIFYVWSPGTRVFILTSPKNERFIMTSYSHSVSTKLNLTSLEDLGQVLSLPPGWKYDHVVIDKPLTIRTAFSEGYVNAKIIDDFKNIYIRLSEESSQMISSAYKQKSIQQ
jgi:hypothetical protein